MISRLIDNKLFESHKDNLTTNMHRRSSRLRYALLVTGAAVFVYIFYQFYGGSSLSETNAGNKLSSSNAPVDLRRLLAVSMLLAKRGGDRLWSIRKGHSSGSDSLNSMVKGKTKEGANELLTKGDLESHHIIYSGIKTAFPGLQVVSEEHDAINQSPSESLGDLPVVELSESAKEVPLSDVNVWIDPLDATQEYSDNLLHYVTTMVCVTVRGAPVIGVIYQPFNNELIWGFVGRGLSSNLERWLGSRATRKGNTTKIVVSRSHAGNVEKTVKSSIENVVVVPAGGAGYKVMQLLNSSVDAYIHTTRIKKWDICAGNAILNAASGRMTTLTGQVIDYSDIKNPVNDKGLLATLFQHEQFLKVFNKSR